MNMDANDSEHFTWTGTLVAGELKFLTTNQDWFPCFVRDADDSTKIRYREVDQDYPDYKWEIFILVRLFGGVPMPTEPLTSDSNLKMPRASVDEVYALIISDLQEAIARLPQRSAYGTKNVGRASKEAAMVELARVYLTYQPDVAKYNEVVRICEEITSMGYQLAADYADNFNPAKQNGVESIFEIQYYGKTNHDFWSNENQASWISPFQGPRNSGMAAGEVSITPNRLSLSMEFRPMCR